MNQIVIDRCFVCKVKYVPQTVGKQLPGEAECNGDIALFLFEDSHNVIVVDGEPYFGNSKPSFLRPGDEIVAKVEKRGREFVATAWTHFSDYSSAMEQIQKSKLPKPAPAIPTVAVKPAAVEVQPEKQNNTGRDRRPVFKTKRQQQAEPRAKVLPFDAKVADFETQLSEAAAEQIAAS